MASQTIHVLGPDLEPRPVWVPGELYIGGAGLAREYWRDEARTAAGFVTRPDTGERLYRTGDLGRWLPDGTIEFLGREDLQVKIQGYRIELGEIEAALSQHPGVRLCAVAALGARQETKRLVAWYVADRSSPDAGDLSGFLSRKLPPYMIPTAFVELEAMPLTPNGKVDRRALPEPGRTAGPAGERVVPRDGLEAHLAGIWQDLLGLPAVGIRDDFFDLGGHSLLAVRLMSRIRAELGRDLPLATLFDASTVESLAAVLRKEDTGARTPLVLIRHGEGRPLFLVHPVGGGVLCYRDLAQALGDGPVWAFQSPEDPPPTLEEMAAVYLQALRAAQPQGPYRLAGWSMGGTLAYEMARQLQSHGEEVEQLVLIDASVPGAEGPVEVDDATLASWFARDLGGLASRTVHLSPEALRGLTREEQVRKVLERAVEAGALAPDFEADELRHHLEIFRRNFRALLSYVPGTYPGPLLAIVAEDTPADAAAPWRSLASRVEEHRVPGDHYILVQPPQVEELARLLRRQDS
jgi:pyochelin synthetase